MQSPEIVTGDIKLRALCVSDCEALLKLRSNPIVNKYIDRVPFSTIDQAHAFITKVNQGIIDNQWHYWAICKTQDPSTLIGTICLWNFSADGDEAEVGYELDPEFHRLGVMSKSLNMVLNFCQNHKICKKLIAKTMSQNLGSKHLLSKSGFHFETASHDNPELLKYYKGIQY